MRPRDRSDATDRSVQAKVWSQSVEGTVIPNLPTAKTTETNGVASPFDGYDATIILAFRSTCPACDMNHPNWRDIVEVLSGLPSIRIVAATEESIDIATAWLDERNIVVDEIVIPRSPGELRAKWRVEAVPATYVVDNAGTVTKATFGVLSSVDSSRVIEAARSRVRHAQSEAGG